MPAKKRKLRALLNSRQDQQIALMQVAKQRILAYAIEMSSGDVPLRDLAHQNHPYGWGPMTPRGLARGPIPHGDPAKINAQGNLDNPRRPAGRMIKDSWAVKIKGRSAGNGTYRIILTNSSGHIRFFTEKGTGSPGKRGSMRPRPIKKRISDHGARIIRGLFSYHMRSK